MTRKRARARARTSTKRRRTSLPMTKRVVLRSIESMIRRARILDAGMITERTQHAAGRTNGWAAAQGIGRSQGRAHRTKVHLMPSIAMGTASQVRASSEGQRHDSKSPHATANVALWCTGERVRARARAVTGTGTENSGTGPRWPLPASLRAVYLHLHLGRGLGGRSPCTSTLASLCTVSSGPHSPKIV